ncbi:MAG: YdcF family protein [Ruminococcus sp.]|nr:YdcF family protein [Ruminococcus sp.]
MSKTNRKDKKKRKIKKRFIFVNIVALVMILFFVKYIDIVGDHYDVHSTLFTDKSDFGRISVSFEPEGIVKASDAFLSDDGEVLIPTASERTGETDMTIGLQRDEEGSDRIIKTHLRVTVMGTIVEEGEYFTNFNGYRLVTALFLLLMLLIMCVMVFSFIECYRKSDYSYQMVAYGGIAIFLAVLLAIVTYKVLNNVVNSFSALVALIMQTGEWFIFLLAPFLLVMAVALSVSNIWLMRHEGFRPANALGIIISIVWLIGVVFSLNIGIFGYTLFESEIWYQIRYILTFIVTYFECMLMSTSVCAFLASRFTPPLDRDFIIILGCAIRSDGSLTPLLKGRADAALRFEKRQYEETGRHACFVPSGGQGADEVISEGEAMERYLLSQGVDPERIRREDKSVNTFENMEFSKAVIEQSLQAPADIDSAKIAFSTTNYHVFRGYILAAKNGYTAKGISAKTKWYFFPNAFIREFIGLLADQVWRHIGIIIVMIAILLGIALIR